MKKWLVIGGLLVIAHFAFRSTIVIKCHDHETNMQCAHRAAKLVSK